MMNVNEQSCSFILLLVLEYKKKKQEKFEHC